MKKFVALLALTLVWGCQDRAYAPFQFTAPQSEDVGYGKSVIKLPALALAKAAAKNIDYKFTLSISGDGMQTMNFSWPISGDTSTAFTIDKIPAGKYRQFEGTLYGSNGDAFAGTSYADIYAGKTAYVSLVLRKSGSAQIDVIIEDLEPPLPSGCFALYGKAGKLDFSAFTLQINEATSTSIFGYLMQNGVGVGKLNCSLVDGTKMFGDIYTETVSYYIETNFSGDLQYFKGAVYDNSTNRKQIGDISGAASSCDTVPQQTCVYDTIGAPNTSSCKDVATWKQYAYEACKKQGLMLTNYTVQFPCDKKSSDYYQAVCFECCPATK